MLIVFLSYSGTTSASATVRSILEPIHSGDPLSLSLCPLLLKCLMALAIVFTDGTSSVLALWIRKITLVTTEPTNTNINGTNRTRKHLSRYPSYSPSFWALLGLRDIGNKEDADKGTS